MNNINIEALQQLEFLKKEKVDQNQSMDGNWFPKDKIVELQTSIQKLLEKNHELIISNRKSKTTTDSYFILKVSNIEVSFIDSKSIKKTEYTFNFKKNYLEVNNNKVDHSFLENFINRTETIVHRMQIDNYEVIEREIPNEQS